MRRIVVKWKQESRKDSRETPQFRAVLTFDGTCKKVAAVEVCSTAALGEESWDKPEQQSRISDEQILMRTIEALASHRPGQVFWHQVVAAAVADNNDGGTWNVEIDLGTVRP